MTVNHLQNKSINDSIKPYVRRTQVAHLPSLALKPSQSLDGTCLLYMYCKDLEWLVGDKGCIIAASAPCMLPQVLPLVVEH